MNILRFSLLLFITLQLLTLTGCSENSTTTVNNADLPGFNDITTAPAAIQSAAKAVVRIHTARSNASGFFISSTGKMLTNDHVLGDTVCPLEGCYIEITRMRQNGSTRLEPVTVFAVPIAVNVGLDMAVVQLYDSKGGDKLTTPDFLTFNSRSSASLIGTHVTIVGHPEGYLKKWSDGVVGNASGKWFQATAFALPGNSGSPVLDDEGRVVGLIHRGPASLDLFTSNSANVFSICTASEPIMAALNAPLPLPVSMVSTTAAVTAQKFLADDLLYLNAHVTEVTADGVASAPLDLLATACDAALARQDFTSPDDLSEALTPCYHAQTWIECRSEYMGTDPYGTVCPGGSDKTSWTNRFKAVSQLWVDMTGEPEYNSVSFAVARLQPGISSGIQVGAQELQQAVNAASPVLDHSLAYYLAAFRISSYQGINIRDYIVNYQNAFHYELNDSLIAYGASWLYYSNLLNKDDLMSLLSRLHDDPNVSLGARLSIEDLKYQYGTP
jgi:V8-like Glu-specific endopeptidase